jgi:hypothetical protein
LACEDRGGDGGVDAGAAHLEVELAGDGEDGVSDFLGGEAAHVVAPEVVVLGIFGKRVGFGL